MEVPGKRLIDQLRETLAVYSPKGEPVTVPQIAQAWGFAGESQLNLIRSRMRQLVDQGEVRRVKTGVFARVRGPEFERRGEGYARMWRVMRAQAGVFTVAEICALTRYEETFVRRYLRFLAGEGFAEKAGRGADKHTVLWRLTLNGRAQRVALSPPAGVKPDDEFIKEKQAVAALCRILLTQSLELGSVRASIGEHIETLQRRFGNGNESEAA